MSDPNVSVKITADSTGLMSGLEAAGKGVSGFASQVESQFTGLSSVFANFAAPLVKVTALLGGGALFGAAIQGAIEYSKEVAGLQRIMGGTAETASTTAAAIKSIGGSVETYEGATAKLTKTLNKNEEKVLDLGVATRDGQGHLRALADMMPDIISALSQYEAGIDRDAAAQSIFGKSFADVLPLMRLTPAVMAEARMRTWELGSEMTAQSQGTMRGYRKSVFEVNEGFEALKVRVALEVMPTLTSMAHWIASTMPAGINTLVSGLQSLGSVLSSTTVQLALGAVALQTVVPLLGAIALRIPIITTLTEMWRVQMALAAREGVTGLSAVTRAARGTASGLIGMINPWMAVAAVAVAAGVAFERYLSASERSAKASAELSTQLTTSTSRYTTLRDEALKLDGTMRSATSTTDEKKKAAAQLKIVIDQLNAIYPDFNKFLIDENGHQRTLTEAITLANKARREEIEGKIQSAKASIVQAEAEAALYAKSAQSGMTSGIAAYGTGLGVWANQAKVADAKTAIETYKKSIDQLQESLKALEGAQAAGGKKFAGGGGKEKKGQTQMQVWEEELSKAKADIEQANNYTASMGQAGEREYWTKKLAVTKVGTDEWVAVTHKITSITQSMEAQAVAAADAAAKQTRQLATMAAKDGIDAAKTELSEKERIADADLALGKISAAQHLALKRQYLSEALKLDLQELTQAQASSQGDLVAWQKLEYEKLALKRKFTNEGKKIEQDAAKEQLKVWEDVAHKMTSGFAAAWGKQHNLMEGVKGAFRSLRSVVVDYYVKQAEKAMAAWAMDKAKAAWTRISTALGIAEIKAKDAAETTSVAQGAANTATVVAQDTTKSASNTGTAATGFFASFAGMGPWGFALAAAAIIAMFAMLGSITGRAKGGLVDSPQMTMLGEGGEPELVIPESGFREYSKAMYADIKASQARVGAYDAGVGSLPARGSSGGSGVVHNITNNYHNTTVKGNQITSAKEWGKATLAAQKMGYV